MRSITCSRRSAKSKSTSLLIGRNGSLRDPRHLGDGRDAVFDLLKAVRAQRPHSLRDSDLADLVGTGPLYRQIPDLVGDRHDLVEAGTALVARAAAAGAAHGLVGVEVERHV